MSGSPKYKIDPWWEWASQIICRVMPRPFLGRFELRRHVALALKDAYEQGVCAGRLKRKYPKAKTKEGGR